MQYLNFATLLALASTTLAAPATSLLDKREDNPANRCFSEVRTGVSRSFDIYLTDDRSIDKTCGGGILDNIRGRCGGVVSGWSCDYQGSTGAHMWFSVALTCSDADVAAALHAAGGPDIGC